MSGIRNIALVLVVVLGMTWRVYRVYQRVPGLSGSWSPKRNDVAVVLSPTPVAASLQALIQADSADDGAEDQAFSQLAGSWTANEGMKLRVLDVNGHYLQVAPLEAGTGKQAGWVADDLLGPGSE